MQKLHKSMETEGFERSTADHSLYTRKLPTGRVIVSIHADDMAVAGTSTAEIDKARKDLTAHFGLIDEGPIRWQLGIAIERDRPARTIHPSQESYISQVIERYKLEEAYPVCTPMDPHVTLTRETSPKATEEQLKMSNIPYREAVGSLMYLAVSTPPDIAYAEQRLARCNDNPGPAHRTAAQRVIKYPKGTKEHKLTLGGKETIELTGFMDSDWASDTDDRKSTGGYVFTPRSGAISWRSKRHEIVSSSSTEAEYISADRAAKETVWLRELLKNLEHEQESASTIYCDNLGAIALTKNPAYHARSKHIDVNHHPIREKVEDMTVELKYIPTTEMTADVLTKGLPGPKHKELTTRMGVIGQ